MQCSPLSARGLLNLEVLYGDMQKKGCKNSFTYIEDILIHVRKSKISPSVNKGGLVANLSFVI